MITVLLGAYSCSKDQEKDQVNLKSCKIDYELNEEIQQAKLVFKHLYLPVEMSDIFEDAGEEYNPELLRNPTEVEKIIFSNEIAIAMGVYGVNIGYVRLFNQWNKANLYFQSLKELSTKIGISANVYNQLLEFFDQPVYNRDTLEYMAKQVYIITDYNLRQNGRDRASALIILGGWLEAMNMALEMYTDHKNEIIMQKICDQDNSLNSVITLLAIIENDELLKNYLEQLYELQNLLRGLNAAYIHYSDNKKDTYSYNTMKSYLVKIDTIVKRMLVFAV